MERKISQSEKELLKGEDEYKQGLEDFNKQKSLAEEGFLAAEEEIKKG